MSELEQETIPLLEPMLHGQTRILDRDRQAVLARWAVKTVTMLEFLDPHERAIQEDDARWLYEHREPPPRTIIWIASYRGNAYNAFYRHDVMQPGQAAERTDRTRRPSRKQAQPIPPPVSYGTNFGVRHVAFQVFGTTQPNHRFGHIGLAAAAFEQLWPIRRVFTWPPAQALNDDSLQRVLQMFATAETRI
jgi:hypothetical protein